MSLKIVHYGDIQIELRISGEGSQRFDEFKSVFWRLEKRIEEINPDIIVIPGDIYQFAQTEGEEQEMFANHLHKILPHTQRIIIIPGNHDIKQKVNGLIKFGKKFNTGDSIGSVVKAIKSDKISYYNETGVFEDPVFNLKWAVWSQINKHSAYEEKPPYSPWELHDYEKELSEVDGIIELYHDPIKNAKGFDDEESKQFTNYAISLNDFKSNTIVSADIHNPDIIWFGEKNEKLFTYCSSLVQRNYGEGNYYSNEKLTSNGNDKHGFNIIEFDLENNLAKSCIFERIINDVSRHTVYLSHNFDYSDLSISLVTKGIERSGINKIRLVCQADRNKFAQNEQRFLDAFKKEFDDKKYFIEFKYSKDIMNIESSKEEFETFAEVLNKEKILEISKNYISVLVDKTSIVDKEDKEEIKEAIYNIFVEQYDKHDFTKDITKIDLIEGEIDNFMNYGKTLIKFTNNQISKILGTNGVGKTKIHSFVNWILNDKIDHFQNSRDKKYNYFLYFNDSSEKDKVYGSLKMFIGNAHVEVQKTLTRSFKQNKTGEKQTIEDLKSIPTVDLKVIITENGKEEIKTGDEAFEYLSKYFNFEETYDLTFVDSYVLKNLIKTPTEELTNKFLSSMGINITDDLIESFENVKEEKMKDLAKPSEKKEEVQAKILSLGIEQSDVEIELLELKNSEIKYSGEIEKRENDISNLNENKYKVPTTTEIEFSLDDCESQKQKNVENLVKNQDSKKELEEKLERYKNSDERLKSFQDDLNRINNEIISAKEDQYKIENEKVEHHQKITNKVNELKSKIDEERHLNSKERESLNSKISYLELEKSNILKEYEDEVQKHFSKIRSEIESHETILSDNKDKLSKVEKLELSNQNDISNLKFQITTFEDTISELENSKTCKVCGSELKEENLNVIKEKVSEIQNNLMESKTKLDEENSKSEKISKAKDELNEKINTKSIEIKKSKDELFDLETLRNGIEDEKIIDASEYLKSIKEIDSKINNHKTSDIYHKDDEYWTNRKSDIVKNDPELDKLVKEFDFDTKINSKKEVVNHLEEEKSVTAEKIKAVENIEKEKIKIKDDIQEVTNKIIEIHSSNKNLSEKVEHLNTQFSQAKENELIDEKIKEKKIQISELKIEQDIIIDKKMPLVAKLENINISIKNANKTIEEIRKYKLVDSSLKLYKQLLSKKGLPQYLFSTLRNLINSKLNESLSEVDFRLIFEEDTLDLRFIDLEKNSSRPVQFISGMQETLVGLSMVKLLININRSKVFNFMFIDEISGKVTDGKKLSYESKNYKNILRNFIQDLSKEKNIYIVDHVLSYDNERILEVQPGNEGSIIVEMPS